MQRCHRFVKLFRRRPWLNWVAVWSPPMAFYLALKCVGCVVHFAVVALLLAAAFLPSAARFSDPFFQSSGVEALVVVTEVVCILMALGLACFVDLAHWWSTAHATQPRKSMAPSFTTPTYLDLGFAGYNTPPADIPTVELPNDVEDVDMNSSGVTVLSAPSMTSDDGSCRVSIAAIESIADVESVAPEDHPSRRLGPRSRLALFGGLSLGLFGLVVYGTHFTAQDASPVVAAVALNPTLNELFDSLFHSTFLPADFSWDDGTATVSSDPVERNDEDLEHNARR